MFQNSHLGHVAQPERRKKVSSTFCTVGTKIKPSHLSVTPTAALTDRKETPLSEQKTHSAGFVTQQAEAHSPQAVREEKL